VDRGEELRQDRRPEVPPIPGHEFAITSNEAFHLPEDKIRPELQAGTLKPLLLEAGSERFADLYLVFADREHAGPGTMRLAQIIREAVASECLNAAHPPRANNRAQRKRKVSA